jgi:type II secretory pathway pseudopilin PulG
MRTAILSGANTQHRQRGFTIAEVAIALAVAALSVGGLIMGYVMSTQRAEWSAYSLAAQSLAIQRIEQARAVKWDPNAFPQTTNTAQLVPSNFPPDKEILDIPMTGGQIVYATNYTTITDIPGPSPVKMIRVDCVWRFCNRGLFTNTIATYRAPDQ